jgi:hypothetical protein
MAAASGQTLAKPLAERLDSPLDGRGGNKKPRFCGAFLERRERMMGLEPTTFCMASVRRLGGSIQRTE